MRTVFPEGTKVRSFDFARCHDIDGSRASYVEGVIAAPPVTFDGCARYQIKVERAKGGGKWLSDFPRTVHPPVNGTPTIFGDICNAVEAITD